MPELQTDGNYEAYLAQLFNPLTAGTQFNPGVFGTIGGGFASGIGGIGGIPTMNPLQQTTWPTQSPQQWNTLWPQQQAQYPQSQQAIQLAQQIAARQAMQAIQQAQAVQALKQLAQTQAVQQYPYGYGSFQGVPYGQHPLAQMFQQTQPQQMLQQVLQQQALQQLAQCLAGQQLTPYPQQTPYRYGFA